MLSTPSAAQQRADVRRARRCDRPRSARESALSSPNGVASAGAAALVRYRFPGRRLFDAVVDIPFALPTAVAGVALTALFAQKGWLGAPLAGLGIKVAFTPIGIFIAMIFIGIPFVVRTVQPVLIDLDVEIEEAAASLGASRWHTSSG